MGTSASALRTPASGRTSSNPHPVRPAEIDRPHRRQHPAQAIAVGAPGPRGVDRELHVGRGQPRPVVEPHVGLELDHDLAAAAGHPPAPGQPALVSARPIRAGSGAVAKQTLEHRVAGDAQGPQGRLDQRVEGAGIAVEPHGQGVAAPGHGLEPLLLAGQNRTDGRRNRVSRRLGRVAPGLVAGRRAPAAADPEREPDRQRDRDRGEAQAEAEARPRPAGPRQARPGPLPGAANPPSRTGLPCPLRPTGP